MRQIEFKLAMPGRGSWDGKWSGEGKNYTLTRVVEDAQAAQLDGRTWTYFWADGWSAEVSARLVQDSAEQRHSHGFQGYGWMVDSILRHDRIYADHERASL
jgi:hypothetical protein